MRAEHQQQFVPSSPINSTGPGTEAAAADGVVHGAGGAGIGSLSDPHRHQETCQLLKNY
jgi:hypothetical protein